MTPDVSDAVSSPNRENAENGDDGSRAFALPERLRPVPERSGLDEPYWAALAARRLVVQRCRVCDGWQWGPEWICARCASFDVGWHEVPASDGEYRGEIFSWERVWHPTDRGLADAVPYVVVLVALPTAGAVRMIGNLLGDPMRDVVIGTEVRAVIEAHDDYSLVQWERC
jgi:uncharacterized OB-fold protein